MILLLKNSKKIYDANASFIHIEEGGAKTFVDATMRNPLAIGE